MLSSNSSALSHPSRPVRFPQPHNCTVAVCPTIALYENELERRRTTELRLRESVLREGELLREKDELIVQQDTLSKESEHRFLNGLQLVNSLLTSQSRSTKNPEVARELAVAANRVAALGRIHRHLHKLDGLESIEFRRYLEELCDDLSDVASGEVAEQLLSVEGSEIELPRSAAVPLGFIASELITNSIKYAKGKIHVSLEAMAEGEAELTVSDDGPGLPDGFDPARTRGLGMKIVAALVRQVKGELSFGKGRLDRGSRFTVRFSTQTK